MSYTDAAGKKSGAQWHADLQHLPEPRRHEAAGDGRLLPRSAVWGGGRSSCSTSAAPGQRSTGVELLRVQRQLCRLPPILATGRRGWSPDGVRRYSSRPPATSPQAGLATTRRILGAGLCDAAAGVPFHLRVRLAQMGQLHRVRHALARLPPTAPRPTLGGHERWANNPLGCDAAGPGFGLGPGSGWGLTPGTGTIASNPTRGCG